MAVRTVVSIAVLFALPLVGCGAPAPSKSELPAGAVSLDPKSDSVTVSPGTQLFWSFESHPSVGKGGSCTSSNDEVLRFVREDLDYEQPDDNEAGMDGADGAKGRAVFEAVQAGEAEVTCNVDFRGKIERTDTFEIIVE